VFLVLGLGNPGEEYERTRHNAGYLVVDALAEKHRIRLSQNKYCSIYGEGEIDGCRVAIAKPLTYMNESGQAAKAIVKARDIPLENLIVVHDDIDLQPGKIKIKHEGGDAGQRGVRSLIHHFHTDCFTRIRVGIGRPASNSMDIADYVLSSFGKEEWKQFGDVVNHAIQLVEETLQEFKNRK
jgi:PTH1 family peptidyl-tRNA hydrolase